MENNHTCEKCSSGMSKPRKYLQGGAAFGTMLVGIYMLVTYNWPDPPAVSGLGFLLAGFAAWTPYCFVLKWILKDK